jgi:alpha-ketoglutarate-dependent taurine dioxygenase
MAYSRTWPMKICFFCVKAAEQGGETPIADSRRVFNAISDKTREQFIKKGVTYVRNYGEGLDLSWQNVFQTEDTKEVEAYCRNAGIGFKWLGENRLRTWEICQAIAMHPQTLEPVWFNQAHLFHISSLPPKLCESLLAEFDEEDLPRNAYFGDGSPIEIAALEEVRRVYQQETITFPWQEGDILMLDNMLTAHARAPFVGQRKIVVGMAESSRQ